MMSEDFKSIFGSGSDQPHESDQHQIKVPRAVDSDSVSVSAHIRASRLTRRKRAGACYKVQKGGSTT